MLQLATVEPGAFSLLEELMQLPALKDFALVGGTALALKFGHRKSDDLDLFSTSTSFETSEIINLLELYFKDRLRIRTTNPRFGIFGFIDGIKTDFVRHPHPLLRDVETLDGIRMFSTEDIIAMKIQAILGRGKKKDFWDIAELLQHYSIRDFIDLHAKKYSTQHLLVTVPQVLCYFADAEESEDPVSLKNQDWEKVKTEIRKKVSTFLQ